MNKVNVFSNRAAVRKREPFKLVDAYTGTEYTFELRPLDEMERANMRDFAVQLTQRYVTGGWKDRAGDFRTGPEVIMLDDEEGNPQPVMVSEDSCFHFAELERMQDLRRSFDDDEPRDGAYNAKELAIIAVTTSIWPELLAVKTALRSKGVKKKVSSPVSDPNSPTPPSEAATAQ